MHTARVEIKIVSYTDQYGEYFSGEYQDESDLQCLRDAGCENIETKIGHKYI